MTIFSRIVKGEIPCYKIAEDDAHFAFLDINPISKGHTLVIPKKEIDYIFDLSPSELVELHLFEQRVAKALQQAVPCKRIASMVLGLEVPHAHIHLIPIDKEGDADFKKAKLKMDPQEFKQIAEKISSNFK